MSSSPQPAPADPAAAPQPHLRRRPPRPRCTPPCRRQASCRRPRRQRPHTLPRTAPAGAGRRACRWPPGRTPWPPAAGARSPARRAGRPSRWQRWTACRTPRRLQQPPAARCRSRRPRGSWHRRCPGHPQLPPGAASRRTPWRPTAAPPACQVTQGSVQGAGACTRDELRQAVRPAHPRPPAAGRPAGI